MRTYRSIADTLGVVLCPDAEGTFIHGCSITLPAHDTGVAGWGGRVHWNAFKRVTPGGLYKFLKLAAIALDGESYIRDAVDWQRIYLQHQAVNRLARRARVRIPFEQTLVERRRVKAMLVGIPTERALRKEAFNWARRG